MGSDYRAGSAVEFDRNWKARSETLYNHWSASAPRNQIQLAFANHFEVFSNYLRQDDAVPGRCLEVGAGRGSISSFFAEAGYTCTLLDASATVLQAAEKIFARNGHRASFVVGDANRLEFPDDTFDVVVSIGLLEHFEDIERPLSEQFRALRPGGRCFCYVVPENPENVQRYFRFVNVILRALFGSSGASKGTAEKQRVYRTASLSRDYVEVLTRMGAVEIDATGMYPLPMISPSPEFPFTLMHRHAERALTSLYRAVLRIRSAFWSKHPWTCDERAGQAFLITFRKPAAKISPQPDLAWRG
jgi:2-polyprenyl-3-methyl-5-hydroxy-6-metoxy-1,4-benzoquinol methylase